MAKLLQKIKMSKRNKKIGLALGSGSARGWIHIGVINALEEANVPIHCISGTSIGSLIGGAYVSGNLKKLEIFARKMNRKTMAQYFDIAYSINGLIDGEKMEKLLTDQFLLNKIEKSCIPYSAVTTDLKDASEVRFTKGNFTKAIRASVSIPGVLTPVKYKKQYLVDGGLVNPLPISAVKDLGANIVIAVDLNGQITGKQPKKPKKEKGLIQKMERKVVDKIGRWMGSRGPNIFDVITNSVNIMEYEITKNNLKIHRPDFLIQPKIGYVKPFDFHLANELIDEGYRQAKRLIPQIKELISKR